MATVRYIRVKMNQMITFFIVLLFAYIGGNIYISMRGKEAFKAQSTGVKVLLSLIFWGGASCLVGSFAFRNLEVPAGFAQTVHEVGTGWLVFTLYMVLFLGGFDLLRLFHIRFKSSFHLSLFLTLCLLGYGYYRFQHPDIQVINMVINKSVDIPGHSLKVVGVSDVHLGYGTDKEMLADYVDMINAQEPDLILIAGDLIDNSVEPLRYEHMEEELSRLKAPYGIYMVPGNHEYISGIEESEQFLSQTPVRLLKDEVAILPGGIQLVGRDDRHNPSRKALDELAVSLDRAKPVIVLDHQPYELDKAVQAGADLQLSGHTHRGQVWPVNWVVDRMFELSYGYEKRGDCNLYVSSGLSLWGPPFRIGTNSEMVVFNITFKE